MSNDEQTRGPDRILDRYTAPAPRPVRRRAGLAVLLLVAGLTGWAVTKHVTTGGLSDAKIAQGVEQMLEGIEGDPEAFDRAEAAFVDAASVSVVDSYPGFLIRMNRRIGVGGSDGDDLHDRVAAEVAAGNFAEARALAAQFDDDRQRAGKYWLRLIDALEREEEAGVN